MRTKVLLAVVAAVTCLGVGPADAQPHRAQKLMLPYAWLLDGQTRTPVKETRIRIARSVKDANRWQDEIGRPFAYRSFKDSALVGVFVPGVRAVRVTLLVVTGSELGVRLAVDQTSASEGAANVVGVPKLAVERVQTVRLLSVDERQLAPVPYGHSQEALPLARFGEHPRAGRVFAGVVARFPSPSTVLVSNVSCHASLGGRWSWRGDFRVLHDARTLRPIIRRIYTPDGLGFVDEIRCSWRIPKDAAGKQLVLGENNCYDDCRSGLMLDFDFVGNDAVQGWVGETFTGRTWRIAR